MIPMSHKFCLLPSVTEFVMSWLQVPKTQSFVHLSKVVISGLLKPMAIVKVKDLSKCLI